MMDPTQEMFPGLKDTFQRMTDFQSVVQVLQEFEVFRTKVGEFGSEMAMKMAMDPKTSPCKSYSVQYCCFLYSNILLTYSVAHAAFWWMMFKSITPKVAVPCHEACFTMLFVQ